MYKIARALICWVLLCLTGASAWAASPTITVYFAGTGVWGGWDNKDISKIGAPELLTTLAKNQSTLSDHYSAYIPGVGVSYDGWEDILTLGNPAVPTIGGRGWTACQDEAEDKIRGILIGGNRTGAIVNLVGWSRGGATAIAFARRLALKSDLYSRISKINILALDPITGDSNHAVNPLTILLPYQLPINCFLLPDKVSEYVGIYADDERSALFGPILPRPEDTSKTKTYVFRVPGSHETMVGNRWTHGHSTYAALSDLLNIFPEISDDRIRAVGWVTKVFVKELLGTPGWGNVRFNPDPVDNEGRWTWEPDQVADDSVLKDLFLGNTAYIHDIGNFNYMRNFSFGAPIVGWEYFGPGAFGVMGNWYSIVQLPAINYQRPLEDTFRDTGCFLWWCWDNWQYTWSGLTDRVPDHITDGVAQYNFLWARGGMRSRFTPPNPSPVANAGPDQAVYAILSGKAPVTLDGSQSSTPGTECQGLSYSWTQLVYVENPFGEIFGSFLPGWWVPSVVLKASTGTVDLPEGVHEITLTVTNGCGQSHSDTVKITVLPYDNQVPVAAAGPDQHTMSCRTGKAVITLDGSLSHDPEGGNLTYTWYLGSEVIANGVTPTVELPEGSHVIDLVVSDGELESGEDSVTITVESLVGDLNCDMCVDRADYDEIINAIRLRWPYDPVYDLNEDGVVNIADARFLVINFSLPKGASCQQQP